MPTILQLRRGTTAEHSSFTGAEGEITVNTTKDTIVVHDGSTAGGFELALADGSNVTVSTEQIQDAAASMITSATHTNITATYDDAAGTLALAAAAGSAYGDSDVGTYLSSNGYGTSSSIIASITDSAPATLDTLNELAAALGDDANFSTTVTNSIATKLNSSAVSTFGLTLVDDADAATARTTLGLGTAATTASTAYATAAQGTTADAALPSASYTAADVLTKIKTVDGSGSGLDADLLDGQSSAYYRIDIYNASGTLLN
jgi:hypothetical protein